MTILNNHLLIVDERQYFPMLKQSDLNLKQSFSRIFQMLPLKKKDLKYMKMVYVPNRSTILSLLFFCSFMKFWDIVFLLFVILIVIKSTHG